MEQLTTGRISLRRTGTYAGAPVAGFVTALHTLALLTAVQVNSLPPTLLQLAVPPMP
jgi:hypothetical protein